MSTFIKLFKTRRSKSGAVYYACKCTVCGEVTEARSDYIKRKKHICKPIEQTLNAVPDAVKVDNKPLIIKKVLSRKRDILHAPSFEIRITATSKAELNKMLEIHKQQYEILN